MVLDMLDSYSGEPIASMEGFSYGGASAPATMTRDLAKVFPAVVL